LFQSFAIFGLRCTSSLVRVVVIPTPRGTGYYVWGVLFASRDTPFSAGEEERGVGVFSPSRILRSPPVDFLFFPPRFTALAHFFVEAYSVLQ